MTNKFSPLDYPILFAMPRRLTPFSSWHQHIPFAMFLVDALRPDVIVELGTFYGDSYCAFCQAVQELGLPSRCYAIDTWQGDPQTGFYGPEVLADLRAHHDPLYSDFSRLVQSTFDDAVQHFPDGSIDLLHIDGYHTYETVKHDFETWLPKLSRRGVVLLHDINVREDDFGVWKFWEELKERYPHFEFHHGHGLGLAAVGAEPPRTLSPFLEATEETTVQLRRLFHLLGQRLSLEVELRRLRGELEAERIALAEARRTLAQRDEELSTLHRERDALRRQLAEEQQRSSQERTYLLEELRQVKATLSETEVQLRQLQMQLHLVTSSLGYRMLERTRRAINRLAPPGSRRRIPLMAARRAADVVATRGWTGLVLKAPQVWRWAPRLDQQVRSQQMGQLSLDEQYQIWLRNHALTPRRIREMREEAAAFPYRPKISIIMPVYNTDPRFLREAIESVRGQLYDNWELCIGDDGSTRPETLQVLEEYRRLDQRIKVTRLERNQGISAASNAALALATGEFVGFLDHDDELKPDALYHVVKLLNERPDLDMIYSDEDTRLPDGRLGAAFFKPDWSPDLILSVNYVCHFAVYRRTLVDEVGGLRSEYDFSQDYDLVLRVTERTARIAHIPLPLYTWRRVEGTASGDDQGKSRAMEAAKRALADAMRRRGIEAEVVDGPFPTTYRVRYRVKGEPLVSIIIPTRGTSFALSCLRSIRERTAYRNYEIRVIHHHLGEEATWRHDQLVAPEHFIHDYCQPFNFSRMCNLGAVQSRGEYLLFLNDDTEVIEPEWLEAMLEQAQRPQVAVVGARLLYPDGRPQHEGIVMSIAGGSCANVDTRGYYWLGQLIRNVSAVTGACMMMRRQVFEELEGFDESLAVVYNDVDICLRARERGYLNVYTPYALLYHYEGGTRGKSLPWDEVLYFRRRWGEPGQYRDPYYNPNLSDKVPYTIRID